MTGPDEPFGDPIDVGEDDDVVLALGGAELDQLAALSATLDPPQAALGVDDDPDPARDREPPGPQPGDGPQDVPAAGVV